MAPKKDLAILSLQTHQPTVFNTNKGSYNSSLKSAGNVPARNNFKSFKLLVAQISPAQRQNCQHQFINSISKHFRDKGRPKPVANYHLISHLKPDINEQLQLRPVQGAPYIQTCFYAVLVQNYGSHALQIECPWTTNLLMRNDWDKIFI